MSKIANRNFSQKRITKGFFFHFFLYFFFNGKPFGQWTRTNTALHKLHFSWIFCHHLFVGFGCRLRAPHEKHEDFCTSDVTATESPNTTFTKEKKNTFLFYCMPTKQIHFVYIYLHECGRLDPIAFVNSFVYKMLLTSY